jgi:PKD repeat protein
VGSFTAVPVSGVAPLTVTFTDTSSGTPAPEIAWDLGDATTTNTVAGASFSHTYAAGTHTVTLVASNSCGAGTPVTTNVIVITALQSWQNTYGVAADNYDPLGSGMSNTNKYLAGFNPNNSAARLRIISIVKSAADINVTYLGANGDSTYVGGPSSRTNVLEYTAGTGNGSYTSTNFLSTGVSQVLSGGTGLGSVSTMVDVGGATNKPSRFYRVRVIVP